MASSVSLDACDLSMYASLCATNSMNYLGNSIINSEIPPNDAIENESHDHQHDSLKYLQKKADGCDLDQIAVSHEMAVTEKYRLDLPDTSRFTRNYTADIDSLSGIEIVDNVGFSCSNNQGLNDYSKFVRNDFLSNYESHCINIDESKYQLMELSSISKSLKEPPFLKSNENYEMFLDITDGGVVIAMSPSIKISGQGQHLKFDCCQCGSSFVNRFAALNHLTDHPYLKPFQCISCDSLFSTEIEVRLHFKTHSVQSTSASDTPADSNIPTAVESVPRDFHLCSVCGNVFESVESLSKHKGLFCHSSDNISVYHNCSDCEERFPSLALLESHEKSTHSNASDILKVDKDSTSRSNDGKQERKWICKMCEKSFRTSKALQEHEVVHTGARDFPCSICGKAFGTAANMRIHLMTHSDQRPFACLTCGATFRQKDSLKVHVRKHTGERPFVCSVCNMAFDRNFTLKNHMLKHVEKSFVCSVCGKAFSTRGGLNNHERLHFKDPSEPKKERPPRSKTGTGNWICDECGKIYSTRSNLKMHKKSHEPTQVSHVCPVCSHSYKSRDSMEVHMRRHTEERPFKCTMCSRSFFRNYTLKIHILTHTGEKPHRCPIEGCSKSFAQTSSLSYHVRNHKKKEERNLNQSTKKRMYRKRKSTQENLHREEIVNCNTHLNHDSHLENCEIPGTAETSVSQGLKLNPTALLPQSLSETIVDPSVESMLDDMAQQIDPTLPAVWDENESVGMLGVVDGLHHSSQHQGHSGGIDLQQQHCQQVSLMQYVPSDTLPLLVSVPDSTIYEHDHIHKALSEQPILSLR